jgi:transposase-like protein
MSGAGELAMFLAIGASAVALLFGPVGSALGRRLAGRHEPEDFSASVEEMRAQVTAEVDDLRNRLVEVEERLDFAERLLAHGEHANQLPGGTRQ